MEKPTPTGRRSLTPGQLRALAYPQPRAGGPSRGPVLAMTKKAAPLLGLTPRLIGALDMLFSVSFDQDWTGEGRPIVWPSNRRLEELTGLGRSQVKALLRILFDQGLIAMRDSGTGRRCGVRAPGGRIVQAFGIDLSPLAARYREFATLVEADDRRRAEAGRLRAEVSALRRAILALTDRGMAIAPGAADWAGLASRAVRLARAATRSPTRTSWGCWPRSCGRCRRMPRRVCGRPRTPPRRSTRRRMCPSRLWKVTPRGRKTDRLLQLQTNVLPLSRLQRRRAAKSGPWLDK